jgi:imidazolonepropionase-like amidohydrolase
MRNPVGRTIGRRYMAKFLPESTLSGADAELATLGTDRIGATVVSLHEAGVRIAVGTDSPNPSLAPGYSMQQEMRELQHQGLAALDVLRAATATGGELLNDVRLGTLRAGSHADLLALNGDPSNDVDELKTLDRVMLRGRWTDRPAVAKRLQNAMNDGD